MARRKKETAINENITDNGNGTPQPEGSGYAETLRAQIGELEARRDRMDRVQDLIRSTMRKTGVEPDDKLAAIVAGLYDMGLPDEEVAYVMEQKEGRDGNMYMGYTFAEVNAVKSSLRGKQVQLAHLEGRGGLQAALEQPGNEAQPDGMGGPGR